MRPWLVTGILAIALIITELGDTISTYKIRNIYSDQQLYQKSFYELVGQVNNIQAGCPR